MYFACALSVLSFTVSAMFTRFFTCALSVPIGIAYVVCGFPTASSQFFFACIRIKMLCFVPLAYSWTLRAHFLLNVTLTSYCRLATPLKYNQTSLINCLALFCLSFIAMLSFFLFLLFLNKLKHRLLYS